MKATTNPIPPMPPLIQKGTMNTRSQGRSAEMVERTVIQNDDELSFTLDSTLDDSNSGSGVPYHVNVSNTAGDSFASQHITQVSILDENERLKAVNESLQRQNDCYMQMHGFTTFSVNTARLKIKKEKPLSNSIKTSMQQRIIPFYKWIPKEEMSNLCDSSIAAEIMNDLGIEKAQWAEFWAEYSSVVWVHSNTERSKMNRYIKDAFEKGKVVIWFSFSF